MSDFGARPESKPLAPHLRIVEVYPPTTRAPGARTTEQDKTLPPGVLSAPHRGVEWMAYGSDGGGLAAAHRPRLDRPGLGIAVTGWSVEARRLHFLGKVAFVLGVTISWPLALLALPLWRD